MTDVERHDDRDAGFNVVELAVTMMISMIVMVALFGVLDSQMRAERRVNNFADNQEELRLAIVAMQRDIRSSEPLRELTPATSPCSPSCSADYALRIDLNVYDDIVSASPSPLRWRVDTATRELRRELMAGDGITVLAVTHRVRGVANNFGSPLFRFFMGNQQEYFATDMPRDIAQCTIRIKIRLVAAPKAGPSPAVLESDAQLRNRLPGGVGCPQTVSTTTTTTA